MKTYDIEEAAKVLKYNKEWLREKIRRNEIKASKVGRKWIITQDTINNLLGLEGDK